MDHRLPLERALGPERAAAFLHERADELTYQDHLDASTALRWVCERAASSDPLLLAAAGQLWQLREDVDIDDAPARRLNVEARLTCPPRVLVTDPDDPTGETDELLIEVLDLYRLATWHTELFAAERKAA
ncbi:MAG TPA: hypothetical protein VFH94_26675 [Streptomyces sp.]|nr:hypothetical protein [Streptomyces sp.]